MPAPSRPTVTTLPCDWFSATDSKGKLLVVLHGRGDSSRGFHWLPGELDLPGLNYLMVNAPDEYYGGRSWYDLPPLQAPGVLRSRSLLDRLFEELLEQGYRASDIGLLGFSQGSLMTLEWGLRSPLNLGIYVGISGYCLDPAALLADQSPSLAPERWLITHGRQDEVLPYETSRRQIRELSEGGLDLRFESYDKGHTIDPLRELPLLRQFIGEGLDLI